ncbi:ClpXP protease specificity-enhancing factor [Photobacterium kishitanii]|uniref:Stringent starvation protein B n=1 Tax=Photobacterium kishitanii TaxID=318456 RepID=A0A0B7J4Q1_9GAMM|nr:ClpXP protease specificity-enhancing factor [Photobacterium kishitanii]OBU28604.1 ClpXP protease specificity-enhancing factor [Photobacterium kishitanii]PSU21898.1 ClpXP protease specificity-enhancing factor [Photobacterium kishitanii]PSU88679.1 ClpXP protease specificity-enhancing factor [Photobacterium kishitanii]PSU94803.1 ClpXP protease specificity-enhancing factor [Photobacterium kishitanii]PSV14581.1 ClpXP protease specificity-enhancing factor [Photobacterium kishitanii]
MDMENMTPRRPYLLRAFYDWLVDNDLTPHLVVDATLPGVKVPMEFVSDGQIILNIAPMAVGNLELSNEAVSFSARFSGRPHSVIVPMYAVLAIYARENGAGTMFEPEAAYDTETPIYDDEHALEDDNTDDVVSPTVSPFAVVTEAAEGDEPDDEPPRPRGRPSLRVVK